MSVNAADRGAGQDSAERMAFAVLVAISAAHFVNDVLQALLPAIYPMLKTDFALSYAQIGIITMAFQLTASLLQPFIGLYTDRHPLPYSLTVGMGFTLLGLLLLSVAPSYIVLVAAASLIGIGSSVFHPEASRIARLASGGHFGFAQSFFQVGGNAGQSAGPLLAAFIVVPLGQKSIALFSIVAFAGMVVLTAVGRWYAGQRKVAATSKRASDAPLLPPLPRRSVIMALAVLGALMFSKFFYMASMSSYLPLYLIDRFGLPVQTAQLYLFAYLFAIAAGTLAGGPIGDRIGRKYVIWGSILGALPFTVLLPAADLFWTGILIVFIGVIIASAFSAILVFAQELVPGRVGTIAGVFFGLAFGMGGIAAAVLGWIADLTSIGYVYWLCSFLPAIGLLTVFLPNLGARSR